MYHVTKHTFGRAMIRSGPMSGCMGFEEHKWLGVGSSRKKAEAIRMADECPIHAVVHDSRFVNIHDNGKPPGPREN